MKAKLEKHIAGTFLIHLYHDNGKPVTEDWLEKNPEYSEASKLFQVDYDYPGLAETLGWDKQTVGNGTCRHSSTDGTVGCEECGVTVTQFIEAAIQWLLDHDGEMFSVTDGVMQYFNHD